MTPKTRTLVLFSLGLVALLVAGCATSESKLQAQARVSRVDAEKAALAKVPGGTIKEAELEKEHGKLIWSFDVAAPGTKDITEVHVDAITGLVVGTETETPSDQEKEKRGKK